MTTLEKLEAFLNRVVDRYLLSDIETLKSASAPSGSDDGAANYPLLMTVFGGIELLGNLTSSSAFNRNEGSKRFEEFWSQYMYPTSPLRCAAGRALYNLARHGIAHAFVVKGPLHVVKSNPRLHLVKEPSGDVFVDAVQLADDFKDAYRSLVKPSVARCSALATTMQTRLVEMETDYGSRASELLADMMLPPPASGTAIGSVAAGATLPLFPVTYKPTN